MARKREAVRAGARGPCVAGPKVVRPGWDLLWQEGQLDCQQDHDEG